MAVERWAKVGCNGCTVPTTERRSDILNMTMMRYGTESVMGAPVTERIKVTSLAEPLRILPRILENRRRMKAIQEVLPICGGLVDGICPHKEQVEAVDAAFGVTEMDEGIIIMNLGPTEGEEQ